MLECGEEVKRIEGGLVPVREQLEEAEDRSKGVRREGEGEVERLQERDKELEMVERQIVLLHHMLLTSSCFTFQRGWTQRSGPTGTRARSASLLG